MSPAIGMNVIVVGCGIGGLAAGIGLRREGHSVKILERSSLSSEVGAAITVPPNATRILLAWGVDLVGSRMVPYRSMQVVRADKDPIEEIDMYDQATVENAFGAPYLLSHRVDMHQALWDMAVGKGAGTPVEVLTRMAVVSYDAECPSVTLADGSKLKADLVVAADGVHSRANKYILDNEVPALASDINVIRFMIPTETILEDPKTAQLLARGEGQVSIYTAADGLRWLVRYPCRGNELQNFGAYSSINNEDGAVGNWSMKSNRDGLLQRLQGFHPAILEVCKKTTEILPLWKCADREPLPRLHRGRVVLVGDAAHAMLPNIGQGAAQSIEDAAVLGVLCSDLRDISELRPRLQLYDKARRQRVSAIQIISKIPASKASMEDVTSNCQEFFPYGHYPKNKKEAMAFCFSHDCIAEASSMLQGYSGQFS